MRQYRSYQAIEEAAMTIRTLAVVAASLAAGALCLWSNAAAARGGGHFGGGHFGGMRFGGGHFGGMRFGGPRFGGMRFGGPRFAGPRFGGPRFGGVQPRGRMWSRPANRPFARSALRNTALA